MGHGGDRDKFSIPRKSWHPYLDIVMSSGFRVAGLGGGEGVRIKRRNSPLGSLPLPEDMATAPCHDEEAEGWERKRSHGLVWYLATTVLGIVLGYCEACAQLWLWR